MLPAADSAGQPFHGRSFEPNPFHGDTGEVDPALDAALMSFQQALRGSDPALINSAFAAVVHALHTARLLVPLIAEAGDYGVGEGGKVVEKSQELSIPHVEGPDGRPVAPVFTSLSALTAWKADARPIPVDGARVALATVADGLSLVVLDPGSAQTLVLRRGALQAIATGEPYLSPLLDDVVQEALASGIEPHRRAVSSYDLYSGDLARTLQGPEVVVSLVLFPGLTEKELATLLADISASWSESSVLVARVDGLGIKVVQV